ncbi:MAG: hypothetical protein AAGA48_39770 [Myxococcota bacterium]
MKPNVHHLRLVDFLPLRSLLRACLLSAIACNGEPCGGGQGGGGIFDDIIQQLQEFFSTKFSAVDCPNRNCGSLILRIPLEEVEDCFNWDPQTGWPSTAPPELTENQSPNLCNPSNNLGQPLCTITVEGACPNPIPGPDPVACKCIDDEALVNVENCCPQENTVEVANWTDGVSPEFALLSDICGLNVDGFCEGCEFDSNFTMTIDECPPPNFSGGGSVSASFPIAVDATEVLLVDSTLSSVAVMGPAGITGAYQLAGGVSLTQSPDRIATGLLWAENGTLGPYTQSNWGGWIEQPIAFTRSPSGSFTISDTALTELFASGIIDGVGYTIEARALHSATGNIDSIGGTWSLDYTQTSGLWSATLHLEGVVQ